MKVAKACRECRIGKRRCTPSVTGAPCDQCRRRSSPCSLALRQPSLGGTPGLLPKTTEANSVISQGERLRLTNLYIKLIHDKPHTLFHPATLRKQVEDGTLPDKLLYGILAMAAPLSSDPTVARHASRFASLARDCIKRDLDDMSLASVQACTLVGNICGLENKNDAESLYFGIAFRIAQIIHLPESAPEDDEIVKEVKLRVWWSLFMIDQWSSAGNDLPRQLQNRSYPLPMDETQFQSLTPSTSSTRDVIRPGLWGRMVQLAAVFCEVQDLHRQHVAHEISDQDAELLVQRLASELEVFDASLRPDELLSEENARTHADKGLGSAYVALHLGYHHYSVLLYFHYLDLQIDATPTVMNFASKCRHHAASFSDLLSMSKRIPGCEAVYFIVAHMTVVSSAALLHTLLFGGQSEVDETRARLQNNFSTLVELRQYWPAVEVLTERLFVFQRACMWSADPNTHRADRWMVRFLLHHALPITEKSYSHPNKDSIRDKYAHDAMAILREPKETDF